MSNRRYINAVMSMRRIALTPITTSAGTAAVKVAINKARTEAARADAYALAALAYAAESLGDDNDVVATDYTDAANKALDAADALCVAANALAELSTLYRTEGN